MSATSLPETAMPPPDETHRRPVKANVFRCLQASNTTLAPMFPYLGKGAIVPTAIIFCPGYRGGPESRMSSFHHANSVDEVNLLVSLVPGMLMVGNRMHPVDDPYPDQGPMPSFGAVQVQRQRDDETQHESILIRCTNCRHLLLRVDYEVDPGEADRIERAGGLSFLETLTESYNTAKQFNEDESLRKCSKCGHQNDEFSADRWGWEAYYVQSHAAAQIQEDFISMTRDA